MSDAMQKLGRLCAHHAWVVVFLWLLVAVGLSAGVRVFGSPTDNDLSLPGTDSQSATDVLAQRFPPQQNGTSPIVFFTPEGSLTDNKHKPAMKEAMAGLRAAPDVYSALSPVSSKGQSA
ncbi:MAG: MMPL family transporter, partial [Actinomycetes bacterium]